MKISIRGLQKAQQANNRRIKALKPDGAVGEAVKYITTATHAYLTKITHVDTGALRASRRMMVDLSRSRGKVYTSPTARNPRSGMLTSEYDVYEEARGGSHAAWARTEREIGGKVVRHGIQIVMNGIR